MRVDDQRAKPLGGAVDAGRQPRGACADDQQVDLALARARPTSPVARVSSTSLGLVSVGPVREDHHRQLRLPARAFQETSSLVRVGEAERVRERAALEHVPERGRPARPGVADDVDRVRRRAPLLGPLEQERRDRVVEELVRRRHGPDDVVVDLPVLDRLEDRVAGLAEAPLAPPDEKRALRVRMEPAHLGEELAAARIIDLLPREHDGDVACRSREAA